MCSMHETGETISLLSSQGHALSVVRGIKCVRFDEGRKHVDVGLAMRRDYVAIS